MSLKEKQIKKTYLEQFTIENFKAFRQCTLTLAPLTVLIGENSSGKSSLLQAILLLKQTLEAPPGGGILALSSHYVQFHQFREIIFSMPLDQATLTFELDFKDFRVGFTVGSVPEGDWLGLFEFHINDKQLVPHPGRMMSVMDIELLPETFIDNYSDQYKTMRNFFEGIGYIRPIRPAPERYYDLRGIKPSWIGIEAENIADFLEANSSIKKKVQNWFVKSANLANDVTFKSDRKRGQMEILFTEAATGLEIDISRLGFGFSQILPIVVAAFSDMNMLIFEAPEIHLNPSLHGALTDLFIEGANNGKQVLVETHSEHVIYRIQRRIAEGVIAPEDVAIYYVQRGEEGSQERRLTLTNEGEIPDWPNGFFEAEMEDIYERVLALRNP